MSPLRVAVDGAYGGLGSAICRAVEAADDMVLAARIVRARRADDDDATTDLGAALAGGIDVLFQATRPALAAAAIRAALARRIPTVVGTTAWDKAAIDGEARAAGVPVFYAANYAIGAVLLFRLAEQVARHVPDVAIVEHHPQTKIDAPSGTALHAAARIERVAGRRPEIASLRLDGVNSRHAVVFGAAGQTLELRHEITNNDAFGPGVLLALRAVGGLPPGLNLDFEALLGLDPTPGA